MYSEAWKQDADIPRFWELIEFARTDYGAFVERLRNQDRRSLIEFAWLFEDFASRLGQEPFVDTGDPALSEDTIEDLCNEVVGRGRAFYESVLADPVRMPGGIQYSDPAHRMRWEASNLYSERYGTELPPYSYDDAENIEQTR